MKKNKKIINIFFFIIIFFSITLSSVSAVVEVWSYTDSASGYTSAFFQTADGCNASLTQYRVNHPVASLNCVPSFTTAVGTWSYKESTGPSANTSASFQTIDECNANRAQYIATHYIINPTPCSISSDIPVNITPQKDTSSTAGTYTLLAPIGDFKTAPNNFGDYVNTIFKIAIGLCAALAVIMIVIGGIQYMGDESIFGKTEAKSSITRAILGLLIALGAYALLNTINPDLLKSNINIKQVSAEIEEENITTVGAGATVNGTLVKIIPGPAAACKGGIVNIPSSMGSGQICQDLLAKLLAVKSLTDAKGVSWTISSSIRGAGTLSSCHLSGNATSGNCVDVVTNGDYSNLCVAIAQVSGLNFANEATSTGSCQNIKPYKIYPTTTGANLHINFIG